MNKSFLKAAAVAGFIAVVLGAFGAHGLKKFLTADELLTYETAVKYQFYHVPALLACGMLYGRFSKKRLRFAGNFFIAGLAVFSGSLYVLTAFRAHSALNVDWLGAITPIGGLLLMAGWVFLFASFFTTSEQTPFAD